MKPANFDFTRAQSLQEVFSLLAEYGEEARLIAGGQSLVPTLNMRLSAPRMLIDISALAELKGIMLDGDRLRVGALTRHVELQQSALVAKHVPLLTTAIAHVAHAAIRNRGTLGGNLSLADPASELPACSVALDAEFTIAGADGQRQVRAREFFKDLYETDLQTGDVLVSVTFPVATAGTVHGFREFVRRRGDFAATGLALHAERVDGQFRSLAPVFFAVANTPVLADKSASRLLNRSIGDSDIDDAIASLAEELDVIGDVHTPAAMKLHLAGHFFKEIMTELHEQ